MGIRNGTQVIVIWWIEIGLAISEKNEADVDNDSKCLLEISKHCFETFNYCFDSDAPVYEGTASIPPGNGTDAKTENINLSKLVQGVRIPEWGKIGPEIGKYKIQTKSWRVSAFGIYGNVCKEWQQLSLFTNIFCNFLFFINNHSRLEFQQHLLSKVSPLFVWFVYKILKPFDNTVFESINEMPKKSIEKLQICWKWNKSKLLISLSNRTDVLKFVLLWWGHHLLIPITSSSITLSSIFKPIWNLCYR